MPENTSLDQFVTGDSDEADGSDAGGIDDPAADRDTDDGAETVATNDATGPADVPPASATFDWTPDGAACAACGERVERRWRDDDGMVCADCKAW